MPAGPRAPHPAALSEQEREQVLGVLDSDRLADKSPARVRPELVATGPDQVWTWAITKLKSSWRGLYFEPPPASSSVVPGIR